LAVSWRYFEDKKTLRLAYGLGGLDGCQSVS